MIFLTSPVPSHHIWNLWQISSQRSLIQVTTLKVHGIFSSISLSLWSSFPYYNLSAYFLTYFVHTGKTCHLSYCHKILQRYRSPIHSVLHSRSYFLNLQSLFFNQPWLKTFLEEGIKNWTFFQLWYHHLE